MSDEFVPCVEMGWPLAENEFYRELSALLNKHGIDTMSNTPDFVLAVYVIRSLETWQQTVHDRDQWHSQDKRSP